MPGTSLCAPNENNDLKVNTRFQMMLKEMHTNSFIILDFPQQEQDLYAKKKSQNCKSLTSGAEEFIYTAIFCAKCEVIYPLPFV